MLLSNDIVVSNIDRRQTTEVFTEDKVELQIEAEKMLVKM